MFHHLFLYLIVFPFSAKVMEYDAVTCQTKTDQAMDNKLNGDWSGYYGIRGAFNP